MIWYSHLLKNFPQFIVTHTVKGFSAVNEADVFLEFSCFFYDPTDVGNLISGSSAFSKSSLSIWEFSVLVLLKPSLENFEHYLARWRIVSERRYPAWMRVEINLTLSHSLAGCSLTLISTAAEDKWFSSKI